MSEPRTPDGFHRHPNGGGLVEDTATVDLTVYVATDAQVSGHARVSDDAVVSGHARVSDDAVVSGRAWVFGNAWVLGNARVSGVAWVSGVARVCGDARVSGNAWLSGDARVAGDAQIASSRHILTIGPIGSENQTITLWREKAGHGLSVGCWQDHQIDELVAEVQRRAPEHAEEYAAAETLIRLRIEEWETTDD